MRDRSSAGKSERFEVLAEMAMFEASHELTHSSVNHTGSIHSVSRKHVAGFSRQRGVNISHLPIGPTYLGRLPRMAEEAGLPLKNIIWSTAGTLPGVRICPRRTWE